MKKSPLPPNLRSIPKGYVYLGKGGEFKRLCGDKYFLGYNMRGSDRFNESACDGTRVSYWSGVSDSFYFAPVGSQIARLNGHKAPKAPKTALSKLAAAEARSAAPTEENLRLRAIIAASKKELEKA